MGKEWSLSDAAASASTKGKGSVKVGVVAPLQARPSVVETTFRAAEDYE